jgi:Tol biopolymer transport system component
MKRRGILHLYACTVFVLLTGLVACGSKATPTMVAIPLTPTRTTLPSTLTPSTFPTVSETLSQVSTPTQISSLTSVYQNAFAVAFSADGRFLAFNSDIDGLIPEDQNHTMDPFIYQTDNESIQRISAEEDLPGLAASLSANGHYLLFGARSNSLEPAADHYNFVYLRDLKTGQDELIDFTPLEKQLKVSGIWVSLSPDGHFLALEVISDHWSIYLLERPTGKIIPVSVNPDGQFTNADSYEPIFSPDGDYLAFVSSASNLVAGDKPCSETNLNCGDVFIYEIATGRLERIPAQLRFTMGNPYPYLTISEKAHWLAWTELEEPSPTFHPVIRMFDRTTGKMETVCAGVEPSCTGHSPSISADGRWLAFSTVTETNASGQPLPDTYAQVYLLDHQTGQLTLVSADSSGTPGNGESGIISLQQEGFSSDVRVSGDGRFVAFSSQAANLLPEGVEKRKCFDAIIVGAYPCYDLFLYDRQSEELNWVSRPK